MLFEDLYLPLSLDVLGNSHPPLPAESAEVSVAFICLFVDVVVFDVSVDLVVLIGFNDDIQLKQQGVCFQQLAAFGDSNDGLELLHSLLGLVNQVVLPFLVRINEEGAVIPLAKNIKNRQELLSLRGDDGHY